MYIVAQQKRGADCVKIADLRKGRTKLKFMWAAAQAQPLCATRSRILYM